MLASLASSRLAPTSLVRSCCAPSATPFCFESARRSFRRTRASASGSSDHDLPHGSAPQSAYSQQQQEASQPSTSSGDGRTSEAVKVEQPGQRWVGGMAPPDEQPSGTSGQSSTLRRKPSMADTMMKSLSEVARGQDRRGGNNLILANGTAGTWRELDQKVNKYPAQREFKAIGTGGDSFRTSMVEAVEAVVGPVHVECIAERYSAGGKYISVTVGPVWLENGEQVLEIFAQMKLDSRLKWML